MMLAAYFEQDDGSLPEIELSFTNSTQVAQALQHLHERGGVDAVVGGSKVWSPSSQTERTYAGAGDAYLVDTSELTPFHIVLASVRGSDCPMPDLGVLVCRTELVLDYRMGEAWGDDEMTSLIELLRQMVRLGAKVSVPWWGEAGERDFQRVLSAPRI